MIRIQCGAVFPRGKRGTRLRAYHAQTGDYPQMIRLVRAAALVAVLGVEVLGASCASAAAIGYLAPPGVSANALPAPQRPVASIVSRGRTSEERRDAQNEDGQIVQLLELKPGMTVGDIGAGSGYHTVRLSRFVGPTGSVFA